MRWLRFAGLAALGPVTGPLVNLALRHLKAGRPVLAGLYVLSAILTVMVILPAGLAELATRVRF